MKMNQSIDLRQSLSISEIIRYGRHGSGEKVEARSWHKTQQLGPDYKTLRYVGQFKMFGILYFDLDWMNH